MAEGITEQVKLEMENLAAKLQDYDDWIKNHSSQEIIDFLNDKKTLCTPGFILRRHLQMLFNTPNQNDVHVCDRDEELTQLFKDNEYADLTKNGNVAWSDAFIAELAKILSQRSDFL